MAKDKLIQIRVTSSQRKQFDKLVKQLNTTKSEIIRSFIGEMIEKAKGEQKYGIK